MIFAFFEYSKAWKNTLRKNEFFEYSIRFYASNIRRICFFSSTENGFQIRRIFDSFSCVEYSTTLFFSSTENGLQIRRIFDDWNIRRIWSPFSVLRNRRIFGHFIVDYSIRRIFEGFENIIFPFFVTKR